MAQIIKHRRGSLESVSGATKRAGELLVVTGSSGITAVNGDSILFVGIDGSTVTPANKVLQGTSVPDLTGASYDTSVDGIPFYDSSAEKLYILNKGGNVEVKATANTGGTGIVSGSSQVDADSITNFDTNVKDKLNTDGVISGSSQVNADSITNFDSNVKDKLNADGVISGSSQITYADISSIPSGIVSGSSQVTSLLPAGTVSGSSQVDADSITNFDTNVLTYNNSLGVISGSSQVNADSITNFDSNVKTKLDDETVVSGSAQIVSLLSNQATDFGTGRVSADDFGNADGSSTITGSFVGDGSGLTGLATNLIISGTTGNDSVDLLNDALTFAGTANEIEIAVTNNQVQVGIVENPTLTGNVTITGDLQVQGTTTTVDSTTISLGDNIIQLNGTGAAFGGLIIVDSTAPNQVSGSLLWDATNDYWIAGASGSESKVLLANGDSVVSGSAQVTSLLPAGTVSGSSQVDADSITNFDTNVKDKLNVEGVISGSSQVNADSITNFDSNVKTKLDADTVVSGSSQVIGHLVGNDISTNGISGSSLDITGNAKIDGNLVLGGNITIGDASGDTISFGGEISSDIIPSANNTYDLGSATDKFAEVHSTNFFGTTNGTVNATNGVVSGSSQVDADSITNFDSNVKTKLDAETVVSSSVQVVDHLLNQATDFGTGRVSADSIGNVDGSSTITGSFVGDGSGLTGLVSSLKISGSTGNDSVDLLTDSLLVTGSTGISVAVTDNTITISGVNASTSVKGVASFDADDFSVSSGNVSIKANGVRAANLNSDVAGTGISLNGVDNSIEVDYGSSAGTAVEGDTSLTIQGTSNEIEISGGSITLGAGGTVTVGLPDEVTIQTGSIVGDLQVGADLTVVGNLFVQGTTTTVDSTTIQLGDNIIELNGSGAANAGLLVKDATSPNTVSGSLLWDSTNDYWKGGAEGSEKQFARLDSSLTSGTVVMADANGLLVDTTITDDGTDVSITGDFTIGGLTANSFVVSDGSKTLVSVVPSNAGDLIQWNGSSFVASNTVDGGTF